MHTVRKIAMLNALGVVAYSRVPQAKTRLEPKIQSDRRAEAERLDAIAAASLRAAEQVLPWQPAQFQPVPVPVTAVPTPALARPAARLPLAHRIASVRTELVLPNAEIERFLRSRMYSHFCLLFATGMPIPVVENAVISDTALHFEQPPKAPLKLGSMALLRSAWRAKRQAWLAIRLWRKQ